MHVRERGVAKPSGDKPSRAQLGAVNIDVPRRAEGGDKAAAVQTRSWGWGTQTDTKAPSGEQAPARALKKATRDLVGPHKSPLTASREQDIFQCP